LACAPLQPGHVRNRERLGLIFLPAVAAVLPLGRRACPGLALLSPGLFPVQRSLPGAGIAGHRRRPSLPPPVRSGH